MLMTEHTLVTVHALLAMIESPTVFTLEEGIIALDSRGCQFLLPVSKSTIIFISALCCLNPVLAKLCFPLAISIAGHRHHLDVLHLVLALMKAHVLRLGHNWLIIEAHRLL